MYLLTIKLNSGDTYKTMVQANSKEDVEHLASHLLDDGTYTVEDLTDFVDLNGMRNHIYHLKNNLGEVGPTGSHYDMDDRPWPGITLP